MAKLLLAGDLLAEEALLKPSQQNLLLAWETTFSFLLHLIE